MRLRVVCDPEVDQGEALRSTALDLVDRAVPRFEVEVGRRRGRQDGAIGLDPDAGRVAGIERARRVEVADVMARVAGSRKALEPDDLRSGDADVRLRHRSELAPQRIERVAVEPAGARFEPARIDEMRSADRRHVDLQRRVLAHEHARGAGMVEVDVREQQVPQVARARGRARRVPPSGASRQVGRPAVEQGGPVDGVEQVGADDALGAQVVQVEKIRAHVDPDPPMQIRRTRSGGARYSSASATAATAIPAPVSSAMPIRPL